jgi:hypothetical protein
MKRVIIPMLFVCILVNITYANVIGTVNISNFNNSLSSQANISAPQFGMQGRYYTGIYSWTVSNPTGSGSLVPHWGFCIDLPDSCKNSSYNVDTHLELYPISHVPNQPMNLYRSKLLRELWARDFDNNWLTNPSQSNKDLAGAFGVCIWEIINEKDIDINGKLILDVTTGSGFSASNMQGSTQNIANQWLSALTGNGPFANNLIVISSPASQDFITTPEPATLVILSLGSLILRRKK